MISRRPRGSGVQIGQPWLIGCVLLRLIWIPRPGSRRISGGGSRCAARHWHVRRAAGSRSRQRCLNCAICTGMWSRNMKRPDRRLSRLVPRGMGRLHL
uniref:Uncharacterized protein n=1 Tax=Arundo donax TaxID=35708 RepID=A0A0A9DV78_ARUDO